MPFDADAAYAAIAAHDARFDGRLYVGVVSTGVYCRPVCRVRTPLKRNCRFYPSAASAEAGGFRPCLRCRPELAPGLSRVDSPRALADHAARLIDDAAIDGRELYLGQVAARLGVTDRHLRRIFHDSHGVTPIDYLTTRRLLLAKQLLTDTALPVTEVALASGFSSLRRFNAAFAARYRLSPRRLRGDRADPAAAGDADAAPVLKLPYRPPLDALGLLRFAAARALPGVEAVDLAHGRWRRTLALEHRGRRVEGWIELRFAVGREPASAKGERHDVQARIAPTLAACAGPIVRRLRHALDLDADPDAIGTALAPLDVVPGLRVPGSIDAFETAVRIVLGQQVSVAAARTLAGRIVEHCGSAVETPFPSLRRAFPTPQRLADASADELGRLGIVRQRVQALRLLAREVADGRIALNRGGPMDDTLEALRALPGIGEWTVQMIALRALAWPDAFPASDIGVLNALGTRSPREATAQAEAWRPWRSYAVIALWQRLDKAVAA